MKEEVSWKWTGKDRRGLKKKRRRVLRKQCWNGIDEGGVQWLSGKHFHLIQSFVWQERSLWSLQ